MKLLILLIALFFFNTVAYSQTDTVHKRQNEIVEIYDIVAVYKEHTDGRGHIRKYVSEIKGKIINYDETTGVLTFKGIDGKMYSLRNDEYKYFEYNKEFVRKVKNFELRQRKESGYEISAGFRTTYINFNDNFTSDNYYLWSEGGTTDLPISIYLGLGKYLCRQHFLGLSGEIALTSYSRGYLSTGLRYLYQYDSYKRNTAFYLPVELNYFRSKYEQNFQVNDTVIETYPGGTTIYYPSNKTVEYSLSAISVSLGQGFSFILSNKHSLALELSLIKYFPLAPRFVNLDREPPMLQFSGSGLRFSLIFNL